MGNIFKINQIHLWNIWQSKDDFYFDLSLINNLDWWHWTQTLTCTCILCSLKYTAIVKSIWLTVSQSDLEKCSINVAKKFSRSNSNNLFLSPAIKFNCFEVHVYLSILITKLTSILFPFQLLWCQVNFLQI